MSGAIETKIIIHEGSLPVYRRKSIPAMIARAAE
jgi:tellurite resistance-related uncharacterized protein